MKIAWGFMLGELVKLLVRKRVNCDQYSELQLICFGIYATLKNRPNLENFHYTRKNNENTSSGEPWVNLVGGR